MQAAEGNAGVIATQLCLERSFGDLSCLDHEAGDTRLSELHDQACSLANDLGMGRTLSSVLQSSEVPPLSFDQYEHLSLIHISEPTRPY